MGGNTFKNNLRQHSTAAKHFKHFDILNNKIHQHSHNYKHISFTPSGTQTARVTHSCNCKTQDSRISLKDNLAKMEGATLWLEPLPPELHLTICRSFVGREQTPTQKRGLCCTYEIRLDAHGHARSLWFYLKWIELANFCLTISVKDLCNRTRTMAADGKETDGYSFIFKWFCCADESNNKKEDVQCASFLAYRWTGRVGAISWGW